MMMHRSAIGQSTTNSKKLEAFEALRDSAKKLLSHFDTSVGTYHKNSRENENWQIDEEFFAVTLKLQN